MRPALLPASHFGRLGHCAWELYCHFRILVLYKSGMHHIALRNGGHASGHKQQAYQWRLDRVIQNFGAAELAMHGHQMGSTFRSQSLAMNNDPKISKRKWLEALIGRV